MSRPLYPEIPAGIEQRHPGWPAQLGPLRTHAGVVALRPLRFSDGRRWSRLRLADQAYLQPWEPSAPGSWTDRHTGMAWPVQWSSLRTLARRGGCLPFALMLDGVFAGQVTIGNIIRSSLQSAWIGYWIASSATGGGAVTAAVALAVDHAFTAAGLHRLEATVRPDNAASLRVLAKLGFRREGLFERYLLVEDVWHDHECFAITSEETGVGLAQRLIAAGQAERV